MRTLRGLAYTLKWLASLKPNDHTFFLFWIPDKHGIFVLLISNHYLRCTLLNSVALDIYYAFQWYVVSYLDEDSTVCHLKRDTAFFCMHSVDWSKLRIFKNTYIMCGRKLTLHNYWQITQFMLKVTNSKFICYEKRTRIDCVVLCCVALCCAVLCCVVLG